MAEMTLAAVARALNARADQPGVFSGYASLFGTVDSQGDRVEAGAFGPSLEAWRAKGRRPAMLWQHDPSEPIGLWTDIEEDGIGLRVEGRLLLSIRAGAEAYEHLKAGTVDGLSIGYQAVEARRDRKTGLRRLARVNLWEISLVTFPANQEARVSTVKAGEDLPDARTRLSRSLRRLILTRPILPFLDGAERKNAADYQRIHGHPQPRSDIGRFGHGTGSVGAASSDRDAPQAPVAWSFISGEEGGQHLAGYVPEDRRTRMPSPNSGVTIATGLDLGSHNAADLQRLGIPSAIVDKLGPYLGLKGQDAKTKIDRDGRPRLTKGEADTVDELKRAAVYRRVREAYDEAAGKDGASFDQLPVAARTAILSVAFQYGETLASRTPKFWKHVIRRDWEAAIGELRTFGDAYPSRRRREAGLMSGALGGDAMF